MHLSELEEWKLQRNERDAWREFRREGPRPERLHAPPNNDDINELKQVYSDTENGSDAKKGRSLCYFSDALFSGTELLAALQEAMPHGYHEFNPTSTVPLLLDQYNDKALFQPSREVSAAIYIHAKGSEPLPMPAPETEEMLKLEELDYVNASNTIIRMRWR